ncbi:MAG TPA: type II toxin-antitoxin system RelE/ParE family toxin [Candidatus Aminicenantes bacterium]|nr:type II toxin-antitoxin system RelE/ParE family toxin [Candidatus Aminicenantes bacterium]
MKLSIGRTALKALARCGENERARLVEAIGKLPDNGDIRKLKGQAMKNTYRLRVGRHRVIFVWEGDETKVVKIDKRGDVYK